MIIHILLIKNFYNHIGSLTFVSPLIKYKNFLKDKGYKIKFFYKITDDFFDCDFLLIEKKFFNSLSYKDKKNFLQKIKNLNKKIKKIYVDTSDSTGQIEKESLIIFDKYWKGQILRNINLYNSIHYGGRFFTDFNKNYFKIKDTKELKSEKIDRKLLLKKLEVSWNMGLVNFDLFSPFYHKLHSFLKSRFFFKDPKIYNLNFSKSKDVTCRLSLNYHRETVKFQRLKIKSLLENITVTKRISRFKYFNELKISKISVSPFGWGEICIRDFETFICNSCLMKPDMSQINTWPNYYLKNKSYISFNWNMNDFENCLSKILNNNNKIKEISDYGKN